jgi:hypothetical protein
MFCQYCDVDLNEENSSEVTVMYNLCSECFHNSDTLIYFSHGETADQSQSSGENQDFPLLKPRKEEAVEEFDSFDDWNLKTQKPR